MVGLKTERSRLVCALAVAFGTLLFVPQQAMAYSGVNWYVLSTGCGGSCNLHGTRSSIQWPNKFNIVSNQVAEAAVDGEEGEYYDTGAIQFNNYTGSDHVLCGTGGDTNGVLKHYWHTFTLSSGEFCDTADATGGETHGYAVQKLANADCGPISTPCIAVFIDGTAKRVVHLARSPLDSVNTYAQIVRSTGTWYNINTDVRGTFPGNGSEPWARTSSDHGSGSWTTISSASCSTDATRWEHGTISGGFTLKWVQAGGDIC